MRFLLLFFFLANFFSLACYAQNIDEYGFNLHSIETKLELENYQLQFLEDKTGKLGINEVSTKEMQNKFKHPTKKEKFTPFTTYWLRLRLKSHLDKGSEWILSLGKLSHVDVFLPVGEDKYDMERLGQLVPTSIKEMKNGRYNMLKLFLNPKSEQTLYIRFENKINYPPDPNIKLYHENEWQENLNLNNLVQGFFQGLLWMMLLYNLLLWARLSDRAYIYYVLYIFCTSVYFLSFHGYWGEFLMGDFPTVNYIVIPFSIHLAFVFYLYFMRYFLKTPEIMPRGDTFLKIVTYLFFLATVGLLVLAFYDYALYMLLEKYFNLAVEGSLLLMLIFIFTFGDSSARYFALGTACMLLGGAVMLLATLDYYDLPLKMYYFQWGIVLQVLVFSFALSERFKQSEQDKQSMQRKLIDQLQENHALYTKVQRELEAKVSERTVEIEQQKVVLQEKNQEIELQHTEITQQKHKLEHTNKHITDSITYASKIQTAMLHAYRQIETRFKDAFIFFKPKDIVSGDFFWYAEVTSLTRQEQPVLQVAHSQNPRRMSRALPAPQFSQSHSVISHLKVAIAADCTGHGVPGAFMTVLGNAILNEVVNENRVTEPEQILAELDKKVIAMLKQGDSERQIQDGMDIIVMVYEEETKKLNVSCAKNPLYYVRDFEIHEIPASKSAIGYSNKDKDKTFEKHTIITQEDDIFYATSDGFQDQFGGLEQRKYMTKRMREFFLKISHLPMKAQKEKLEEEFTTWKGSNTQTDDVVILGIKF
jgi:serine phosphatase RsbU (regulator of sigma subunit)